MQSYIKIWHKQLKSYRNWEYDSVYRRSYHLGLGMKYFLVTTNWRRVADAAHRQFKFHDGLTDEDKYPNLATWHTDQAFDLHLCCDFNRPKADKWPIETCCFVLPGFFSPIILARTLQLCGETFGHLACTHRTTAECIFMKTGTGELFEHLSSHLNFHLDRNILCLPYANVGRDCLFFGPKRLSDATNFVPLANFLRCYGFKTTKLKNASCLFHECVLSRQQYFFWMSAEFPIVDSIKLLLIGIDRSKFMWNVYWKYNWEG
jgi:hypothetical protein